MTMFKMVDGQKVQCDEKEEQLIQNFWELGSKYPEYKEALSFDWATPAKFLPEELNKKHLVLVNAAIGAAVKDINAQIEQAQEDDQDTKALYAQRKAIKVQANQDLSACQSPDDFIASIPSTLKPYWLK